MIFSRSVLLLFCAVIPVFSSAKQPVALGETSQSAICNGDISSLIDLRNTEVEAWWEKYYLEAKRQFPALTFVTPDELHVTLLFIGPWKLEDLPLLKQIALVSPRQGIDTSFQITFFGREKEWLVLEFLRTGPQWVQAVQRAKEKLIHEHLTEPSPFDHIFKPHISLAKAPIPENPSGEDRSKNMRELKTLIDFQLWLHPKLKDLALKLSAAEAKAHTVFWLGSATRPPDYPTYIPLDDWLRIYFPKQAITQQ